MQLHTLLSSCVKRDTDRIWSHKSHWLLAWQPQSPTALLRPLFFPPQATGNLQRSNELQCSGSIWISAPPPPSARYCTSTVSVSLSVIWRCPCAVRWNIDQKKSLNSSEVALKSIFRVTLMLETITVIISPCLWSFGRELVPSWHLLVSSLCPSSIYCSYIDNTCKKQHI